MFQEIVEKLLVMKSNLEFDKQEAIQKAVEQVEKDFADREAKICNMLEQCGYEEPKVQEDIVEENKIEI